MKINRGGATRLVFMFDTFVVKIPRLNYGWFNFIQGLLANMTERKYWNIGYDNRDLLCPIIWSSWGGWFVIMQRATPFNDTDDVEMEEHVKYFGGDDTPRNYGLYNGKVVKLDYGWP